MEKAAHEHNATLKESLIPQHTAGKQNDLSERRVYGDEEEAKRRFSEIKQKLLQPWLWQQAANTESASFALFDAEGNEVSRPAREGDYYRIDLAGPGTVAGDGYDWVRIETVREWEAQQVSVFGLTLMANPAPVTNDSDAAHFFKEGASSTFILERKNSVVTLSYHGRNERPNINTDHVVDNIRNAITGVAAMLGFSELQWSALLKGLLGEGE